MELLLPLLPGTPLSPPRPAAPAPKCGTSGKKFGCGSATPSAVPRRPPRGCLLPLLCPPRQPGARRGRCAGGGPRLRWRRGAGPTRSPPAALPGEHAQSAGAWGSARLRTREQGPRAGGALPGEERSRGSSRKGGRASPGSRGLLNGVPLATSMMRTK